MRTACFVFVSILALLAACSAPASLAQAAAPRTYTLDLRDVSVQPVLRELFKIAGKNFTIDPNVRGTVTMAITNATFERTLATVAAATDPPVAISADKNFSAFTVYHVRLTRTPHPYSTSAHTDAPDPADIPDRADTIPAPPSPPGVGTRLTAAQAVQAAQAFCRRIGQPVTGAGRATYPAPVEAGQESYWQPSWQVTFPNQASVWVVDATSVIAQYDDKSRSQIYARRLVGGQFVLKMTMLRNEAIRRAKKALLATGQPEGAKFNSAILSDLEYWDIGWERAYHGIAYKNEYESFFEDAHVWVNTQTGRIEWLRFFYPQPPLKWAVVKVTRNQAVHIAQAYLQDEKHPQTGLALADAVLRVARFAGFSDVPSGYAGQAVTAHAVWIVRFETGTYGVPERNIWVDCETGRIIADRSHLSPGHFGQTEERGSH